MTLMQVFTTHFIPLLTQDLGGGGTEEEEEEKVQEEGHCDSIRHIFLKKTHMTWSSTRTKMAQTQ